MNTLLILEDEYKLRTLLARILSLEGYEIVEAASCDEARQKLKTHQIHVLLSDVKLPDGNGVAFVSALKQDFPQLEIIVMTAYGNIPDGVQAIKNGAFDYITKGDDNKKIIPLIDRAFQKIKQSVPAEIPVKKVQAQALVFEHINGTSPAIQQAIQLAKKVAPTHATVLLTGETGVGKEVFARAIHSGSLRKNNEFVAINCAAFSKEMLENELFGHKLGAFTGAVKDQKGLLERAHQGTLFLDEIAEMPIDLQAKLLRFLENGEFIKIGENKATKVDVRIIAASNRSFHEAIDAGIFRADLYYRISTFEIHLPALHQRKEDIPHLVHQFIAEFNQSGSFSARGIQEKALDLLVQREWKGNVRELKNAVERALILCEESALTPLDFSFGQTAEIAHKPEDDGFTLTEIEKKHIQRVLNFTHGNKGEAARLLNIGLTTLYRKIAAYGIT